MIKLLVQGWRGISHSYAMVNQYQLLELAKRPGVALQLEDLPYFCERWNSAACSSGFDTARAARLAAIAPFDGSVPDVTYRISFPYRFYGTDKGRLVVFGTAERRHIDGDFIYQGREAWQRHANEAITIVTPSAWSKEGFLRYGFADARVHVVPHGVDTAIFRPSEPDERASLRCALTLSQEQFVFLSAGAATENKGLDLLVRAFAVVHERLPHTVLLLKDSRALYTTSAQAVVNETIARYHLPNLWNAIGVISDNVDLETLRQLYGTADAYVSPYRAEGFNLPPLEAAACGLSVLVTAGGATDDYAHPSFAHKIAAQLCSQDSEDWLEPDLDSLIAGMEDLALGRKACDRSTALPWIAENFSWSKAVDKLLTVLSA